MLILVEVSNIIGIVSGTISNKLYCRVRFSYTVFLSAGDVLWFFSCRRLCMFDGFGVAVRMISDRCSGWLLVHALKTP